MKKTIYLFAVIAATLNFTSCSSDDDDDAPKQDQLIGKWKPIEISFNGTNTDDPCDLEGILDIKPDGTFTNQDYESDIDDNCFLDETVSGTWVNKGNGTYHISSEGDTEIYKIEFKDNTFSFTETDGQFTVKSVFQRQ